MLRPLQQMEDLQEFKHKLYESTLQLISRSIELGVVKCFQEAANSPNEDRWLTCFLPFLGHNALIAAVFDGHGGEHCASFAEKHLVRKIWDFHLSQQRLQQDSDFEQALI